MSFYGWIPNICLLHLTLVIELSYVFPQAKMMNIANGMATLLMLVHLCFCLSSSSDTITTDKPINDGELLISKAQNFALGFFSPGKSTKRYVGIWYHNLTEQTAVWLANRDDPINGTSGVLSITPHGNLQLHNKYSNSPVWFTNVSVTYPNNTVIAQLLDTGNLVLAQKNNSGAIIWQSFDHLTDTFLPYSKIGLNRKTGQTWFLQSWKTDDDPGTGSFIYNFSKSEKPELFMYKQNLKWWRSGSFNGEIFTGTPLYKHALSTFNFTVVDKDNGEIFTYTALNNSTIRLMVLPTGILQAFVWDYQKNQWNHYWSSPAGLQCDYYGTCGSNSNCDIVQCSCLPGFEPKYQQNWYENKDTSGSGGCVRKNNGRSICGNGEGFIKVESIKIPETSVANANMDLSLEQCELECLRNCSCTAYAAADVRNGGSGCLAWHGNLMDVQVLSEEGQDLYVRVDAIELANYARKLKRNVAMKRILTVSVVSIAAVALLIAFCIWKRKRTERDTSTTTQYLDQDSPTEDEHDENTTNPNLPFFHFETIMAATNSFGGENKLGHGGFGSVYKGILGNGQEIAVKRLSKCSGQGTQEFKNEIKLIARLQHKNLVRLLGYCIHKEERMLIYEYLPNKSLDFFIFDKMQRLMLNWDNRFEIIFGIARGVLYLHQDSRLKIIHRDLKASNILLDASMKPKISDFGMAKIFGEDQIQAITRKVVGTYGYMSPEYAMQGQYSTKSDVFSFGVLILEIISGKRNTDYEKGRASPNLIGHVWDLWRKGRALDIVDSTLGQSFPTVVVLRCIQIGILCVQESALDRPSMLEVVFMLGNETNLPSPQKPAFIFNSNNDNLESSSFIRGECSVNEVTNTTIGGR